jgi:phosphoglycolate phosphatase-like HAD superfamily hydrolase
MDENSLDATQTFMVGDSAVDVQTARAARVRCCGVAWGFQPESFQENPPDWVIEHPDEILSIVSQCESLAQIRS